MSPRRAITLIGIGDDGCASLTSRAVNAVMKAGVLVGGERHLEFFPQFSRWFSKPACDSRKNLFRKFLEPQIVLHIQQVNNLL